MSEQKRISVVRNLQINEFSGTTLTDVSSKIVNGSIDIRTENNEDVAYVQQRPAIDLQYLASDTVSDTAGRGIYYKNAIQATYFVNYDTIYKNTYSTVVGTISAGIERGTFLELAGYTIFLDYVNGEGWTINASDTLAQISDADFPTTLAGGGAVLDTYLFVMDESGIIYHSDSNNPTSWNALSVLTAEREPDPGMYLTKHKGHIVAMGTSTIEFFSDTANATGSVLTRRPDIFYNTGCASKESVWYDEDVVVFIGSRTHGDFGVYALQNFQLTKISTPELDAYITENSTKNDITFTGSGITARGHTYYVLTACSTSATAKTPIVTFVYDVHMKIWMLWNTELASLDVTQFPIADWTVSSYTANYYGRGILTSGDIISLRDDYSPYDTESSQYYMEDPSDYVTTDYVEVYGGGEAANVSFLLRVGDIDFGTNKDKFVRTLELNMDPTSEADTITVSWSDTDHTTFSNPRTLSIDKRRKLTRLGKTNRRTMQLEYDGDQQLKIAGMEFGVQYGSN